MKTDLLSLMKQQGIRRVDLANSLGVNKSQVTRWVQKRIPLERVAEVERVTGIPREKLRPDFFSSDKRRAVSA